MRIGSKRKNLENLPISSLLVESTKKKNKLTVLYKNHFSNYNKKI